MYIKQKHMTNNNTNEQKPTTNNSASNTRQNPTTNERGTMVHQTMGQGRYDVYFFGAIAESSSNQNYRTVLAPAAPCAMCASAAGWRVRAARRLFAAMMIGRIHEKPASIRRQRPSQKQKRQ